MANFYAQYPASSGGSANASVGVVGTTAPTSATEVAGVNPSGNLQPLQTDSSGNLKITGSISATNPSVGTNGATAPTSSTEVGGINPSGNLAPLQTNASGSLFVIPDASSLTNVNLTEVGGSALALGQTVKANSIPVTIASDNTVTIFAAGLPLPTGAATSALQTAGNTSLSSILADMTNGNQVTQVSNFPATQPISAVSLPLPSGASTAALQSNVQSAPGTSASTAITIQGSASGVAIPISGTVTAPNPSVSATGSAVPAQATYSGMNVSGNLVGLTGTANGLKVDGSAVTQPVSVASLPLPSGAATSANQATEISSLASIVTNTTNITVAQGSTTSGQTGQLMQGAVTTSSPTYSSGQTDPLSLDVSGNLRVKDAADGPVAPGTAASNSLLVGMVYNSSVSAPTNGQQLSMQSDLFGNLEVSLPDMLLTGAAAQTATVNNILPSTSSASATSVMNYRSGSVQVNSTGTGGTFVFEGSNDNVNFSIIPVGQVNNLAGTMVAAAIAATASNIIYVFPVNYQYIRLRIATTITGGSIQAYSRFSQNAFTPAVFEVGQSAAGSLNVTVGSGTITTVSGVTTVSTVSSVSSTTSVFTNTDQVSAAITTTTTSSSHPLTAGDAVSFNVAITAATGTSPTYDLSVQTSIDNTNWTTVYQMPRQTTTGFYSTPFLQLTGINYRYIETIGGATPSFTRSVITNRTTQQGLYYRNLIDRTIAPATTNSTTAALNVEGMSSFGMIVNQGVGGSSVQFALDGSDDNSNWTQGIATVGGVLGGATPVTASYGGGPFRFIRARVITGVASATISYVTLWASPVALVQSGRGSATAPVYNVYSTTNITTSAYTQLVASTSAAINVVDIFDSSGQAMILAVGPSGQEVILAYIPPGGENQMPIYIPQGARIAYKALTANATAGYLTMNFLT